MGEQLDLFKWAETEAKIARRICELKLLASWTGHAHREALAGRPRLALKGTAL